MVLFSIPDIRLFWSQDPRFLDQFKSGEITTFQPYSKYPPCYKDMSFWLPPNTLDLSPSASSSTSASSSSPVSGASAAGGKGRMFHENDYCEIVREVAGDLIENVTLVSVLLSCHMLLCSCQRYDIEMDLAVIMLSTECTLGIWSSEIDLWTDSRSTTSLIQNPRGRASVIA